MSVMVLDAGNSIIKVKIARREHGEIAFPHDLQVIRKRVWKNYRIILQLQR